VVNDNIYLLSNVILLWYYSYVFVYQVNNLSLNLCQQSILNIQHLYFRVHQIKFKNWMTSKRKPTLQKLCKFIRYINMIVCPANSICRFIVLVYIVYSLICSLLWMKTWYSNTCLVFQKKKKYIYNVWKPTAFTVY
jgi:hypothetical protein